MNTQTPANEVYLELIFQRNTAEGDLVIIQDPTPETPGRARLGRANISPGGEAVGHTEIFSWTGAKLGMVIYDKSLVFEPFSSTYLLEVETNGNA